MEVLDRQSTQPRRADVTRVFQGERPLPEAYYRVMAGISQELSGMDRIEELARGIQEHVSVADRELVRDMFRQLAYKMVMLNASDLDMGGPACNDLVWYRVDGFKRPYPEMGPVNRKEAECVLLSLLTERQQERLFKNFALDFGYEMDLHDGNRPRRYRTTIYVDNQWLAVCLRMLAWQPRSLRSLGFHPLIERGMMFRYVRDGITLFTGVTGSGKSTSLDAIVDANNEDFEGHILIVANPLEYIHESKKCIIRHREVGTDVSGFVDGMIQGLRQDPDIVIVGEMRDPETISTAMEMADTGHKVFSTLHTGSAIESIDRIVAEYPTDEQDRVRNRLGDVLRCIISQKLLPGTSGGRVLAKEVLWMTPAARAAVKNGNVNEIYQMIWEGSQHGMHTLEQDLFRLARRGDITTDTAMGYANNKRRLLQLMR